MRFNSREILENVVKAPGVALTSHTAELEIRWVVAQVLACGFLLLADKLGDIANEIAGRRH